MRHAVALALTALLLISARPAIALDLNALWDFGDPALSEQRFRAALPGASGDEALILQTQIARSYGLRGQFERTRTLLASLAPQLAQAGPEARTRYWLEVGRSLASATHPPASQTETSRQQARAAYEQAIALARAERLDGLAIDGLHMLAFVDTSPTDQLRWGEAALAIAVASEQPAAQRWQASLRNNIGLALQQLGRHAEALAQFEQALALRERTSNPGATHVARWRVAQSLRLQGRADEALAIQQKLAQDSPPDRYVFEELEILYRARGDTSRAAHYAALREALAP